MSGRLPLAVGVATAGVAGIVLLAWSAGHTDVPRLVMGWRVMVPSTAFGFLCAGLGLVIASTLPSDRRWARLAVRSLAMAMLVLPLATLLEYATASRWGVELWLGIPIPDRSVNPYAGTMSAMTATTFVLLAIALGALTWTDRWALTLVQIGGGSALAVSWFVVLTLSFDQARITDQPRFPGMAALTVVLFALSSYGVLAASREAVARVRDAGADAAMHGGLVASAFALPLILGPLTSLSMRWVAVDLSTALATVTLALALTVVVWRGLARMQNLQQERRVALADLEHRVAARTGELARINAQLRESEERLRAANRHKDEFLAMLSHELRNPLAPIRTGVELLKSEDTTPAMRADVHRVVERQMTHLVRLIDDLLDVSRITAGKLTLRLEAIDLRDVVEQAVETTRPIVDRARHELRAVLPSSPALVQGDRIRLAQVVANLIENACKYTPRGGQLAVEIADASAPFVELRMRDNGIGIPDSFLPRVFDKFEQAAPMSQQSQGGLGIGLALVRGIVSLHGGTVEAASEGLQRGSEFVVRLPRPAADAAVAAVASEPEPAAAPVAVARRVLVVDDNVDNTAALAMLLRQLGHDVRVAGDGETALERAREFRPEVILLDIGIPKMNGYDVCRELRRLEWGRRIRVIAQTGFGDEEDLRRSAEAGFDGHLVKPIDPVRLGAVLQS
jgi:two-component system CheB/CheR fusion protein